MNFFGTIPKFAIGILAFAGIQLWADVVADTVLVGSSPVAMAVDTGLNKIYVVNRLSNNVTVINGTTDSTVTVPTGTIPTGIAINPVTHKVYITNNISNNVTVIDGSTYNTATVNVGASPASIAVNSITNRIYVQNSGGNTITVINGTNNATATITMQTTHLSYGLAVNSVTNMIYVGGYDVIGAQIGNCYMMIINGSDNDTTAKIWLGGTYPPNSIAVNSITNMIYAVGGNSSNNAGAIYIVNGTNKSSISKQTLRNANFIVINPITNKVFIATGESILRNGAIIEMDGLTNDTASIVTASSGVYPSSLDINPVTNMIYSTMSYGSGTIGTLKIIDCSSKATSTLQVGVEPSLVAVNPITHKIFVGNADRFQVACNVMVIDGASSPTLSSPILVSPFNTAPGQPVLLTLSWKKVYYAASYTVQVSLDSNFSNTVINRSNIDSTFTVISSLDAGGWNYFWRVRGNSSNGNPGPWSTVWKFSTTTSAIRFFQPQFRAVKLGFNGKLIVYALNGKAVLRKEFPAQFSRGELFSGLAGKLPIGIYHYQIHGGVKSVEDGTYLSK